MCYKNNEMNKKMALLKIFDGFEIVELENIHKGDTIIYLEPNTFLILDII